MIAQGLKYLLNGYNGNSYNPQHEIAQYVGDNVFPNVLPQNYGLPAIVYTIMGSIPSNVKEIRAIANTIDVDIDIVSDSYSEVNQLSVLVMSNLHRYKNNFNSNDSDSIGYGTPTGVNTFGMYAPASTGAVQYIGGLQIVDLHFYNAVDSYDDKLELYRNTLSFNITYVDDPTIWGSDLYIKLQDFNLMATNIGATDDPLYTQPIALNQGVNYLFAPSVLTTGVTNISSTTLDGLYENFYDTTGTSNTNRPTLKISANNPPEFNQLNYLDFGVDKFLLSSHASDRLNRKYKEITFFSVFTLPNADTTTKSAALCFKQDSTSTESGAIVVYSAVSGTAPNHYANFGIIGMALEDDGAGGEIHRGFTCLQILSWPSLGINPSFSFESPVYISMSMSRSTDGTAIQGQVDIITSSDFTNYGDDNVYTGFDDTASTTFKEYFFNFESLHSDISNYNTNGAGTIDLNDELNLYDYLIWPEKITFGETKYLQIKRELIEKHNMYKRITN